MGAILNLTPNAVKKTVRITGGAARREKITLVLSPVTEEMLAITDLRAVLFYRKEIMASSTYFADSEISDSSSEVQESSMESVINLQTEAVSGAFGNSSTGSEKLMQLVLWSESSQWMVFYGEIPVINHLVPGNIPADETIEYIQGYKGDKGEKGDKGDQGPKGPKGDKGDQGPKGDKGDQGPAGADGVDGTSFEVTEAGLLAGLLAYDAEPKGFTYLATDTGALYIKQSNTSGDWSNPIPFQGPQGPAGADGAKGDKGDKGDAGEDGAPFTYDDFTQEQLALLVGPEGPEGPRGPAGTDGAKGDKGDQGPAGADGTDGADGLANPMTTAGDIIVGSTGGVPTRLAKGADGKVLGVESGEVAWVTPIGGGGGSVITACVLPVPSDPDEDALHFEAELSLDPLFEAAGSIFVKSATGYASIKVFSGLQWIPFPAGGIGLPFYGSHVRFDVVAEGVHYGRVRWYDGTAWSDYRGFIFPSITI